MSQGGSDKQIAGHTRYSGNNSLLHETSQHWRINVLVGKSNASVICVVVSMCKEDYMNVVVDFLVMIWSCGIYSVLKAT